MMEKLPSNQRKRGRSDPSADAASNGPRSWKYLGSLVMTFGLGATITSGFGLGEIYETGRQRSQEQRCSIAQQIVLGDSLNPALNQQQRMSLAMLAMRKIRHCLGDQG